MEFRLLGPFEVLHDSIRLELGDPQQRFALVILLLHPNRPVSAERLIDMIWGANRPRSNLVTGYIAKIRKVFQDHGVEDVELLTTPTGYVLRLDENKLDTVRFATLCRRAGVVRRAGDLPRATALLHEAVGLWRGRYLEDLDIDRIGGTEVMSLDAARLDALGDLAELELAAGNHRWVRDRLRPEVHTDPTRQRLVVLLMRALIANDDRVEAMNVYHRTRDALDDYGMETSADLRNLARLAQYGEPRSTLPPRSSRFTGRAKELAEIDELAEAGAQVVWVSGMPGIGKTTFAVEAAHRLKQRYPHAQLFVSLNGFTPGVEPADPVEVLGTLLEQLGVPTERIPTTLPGRAALYRNQLIDTRTLIVLDSARSVEQARELLPQVPTCLVIVTSRLVGDLDVADNIRLDPMPDDDAVALFRNLAGAGRLRGLTREVEEVVVKCGRVPLSVKMVASQFRRHHRWPLEHLLRLLDEAGPWTSDGGFGDDSATAYMVSYQQLDDQQRRLFRLFSAFPGRDLDSRATAALANCEVRQAQSLLQHLHDLSLLEENNPDRYLMLDPLKHFAASTLPPLTSTEHHDGLDQLLDYYLVSTAAAVAAAFPFDMERQPKVERTCAVARTFDDRKTAWTWLADERPNLVAFVRYAATHDRPAHTWQLAVLLWRHLHTSGQLRDCVEILELARKVTAANPDLRYGHTQVLLRLSTSRWRSGELDHALELAAQALPKLIALHDVDGEADALCGIALVAIDQGEHNKAIAHFEAALDKYQQLGNRRGQAHALGNLGHLNEMHGNVETAEQQHLAAIDLLRAINHAPGLANTLDNLGCTRQRMGRLDEALADHEEARALAAEIGDHVTEAFALTNLGNTYRRMGRPDEALRHHELAAAANGDADPPLRIQLYLDRGATLAARGDLREALQEYRAALKLAERIGDRVRHAHAEHGLARTLHALGSHQEAAQHWQAAEHQLTELELAEADETRAERSASTALVEQGSQNLDGNLTRASDSKELLPREYCGCAADLL